MKKIIYTFMLLFAVALTASAQANIKFDKTTHDWGKFSEKQPVQSCVFTFTNTGDKPLVINQVVASCGCTAASYTKEPVKPGEKGQISVKYNGTGKYPGHFKKNVTVRTNATQEIIRLYIEGEMTEE